MKLSVDQLIRKAMYHAQKGSLVEAYKLYETVLKAYPKNKRAQVGLNALNKLKQSNSLEGPSQEIINQLINLYNGGQLEAVVEQGTALKNQYPRAFVLWNILGAANQGLERVEAASEAFKNVIELNPTLADGHNNLGVTLQDQGKLDEAIASYQKALSLKPDYSAAYNNMGRALQQQGKFEGAIDSYQKALSLKPDHAEAHRHLSSLVKYKPHDTQVAIVGEMIKKFELQDSERCHLHYTYAKMNEDFGNLDVAYHNYVAGAKLRQKLLFYDFKQDKRMFNQIKNSAPKISEFAFDRPIEAASITPIFILGMPRSGTTMVQQILASHSDVHGAGELPFLARFGDPLSLGNQVINSDNSLQVRDAYLNELEKVSNGFPFVIDKMPQNFLHLGLILKILPEAKIIHLKRDPAATCWSNFKHYFSAKGLGYSYDLNDTVAYFKLYQDLMDFWDQQYSDQIYNLDYDKLTLEQEPETKKLIEHLGLDWEDNCLSPQENTQSVRTASQQQVREKVYSGSSQAWRKFKPYLKGALDELGL